MSEMDRLIREEYERRLKTGLICPVDAYPNFKSIDGSDSWCDEADRILPDPAIQELVIACANSCGKSFYVAATICRILYNKHPMIALYQDPMWIHCISKDYTVFQVTIQKYIEKISNYEISPLREAGKSNFKIETHAGILRKVTNLTTKASVTFGTADKGAVGNIGVRPNLLLCDEPISRSLYEELVVRTSTKNSKFVTCATVIDPEHAWVMLEAQRIVNEKPHNKRVITASMVDNPFVPAEKIQYFKDTFGEDSPQYRVRVLGSLEVMTGVVYEGIEKCIVDNEYVPDAFRHLSPQQQEKEFVWAESHDYGMGQKDPTLIGFFKLWSNGEITQEDEICLYQKSLDEWIEAIHTKRNELDMPFMKEGYPVENYVHDRKITMRYNPDTGQNEEFVEGTGLLVRKPTICVADKQYIARKIGMNSTARLRECFAARKIFMTPSKGSRVEDTLPICQNMIKGQHIKLKERCAMSIKFAKTYVVKYSETSGKIQYDTPENHWSDIIRYLVEKIGGTNTFVKSISDYNEYLRNSNMNLRAKFDPNKYRTV